MAGSVVALVLVALLVGGCGLPRDPRDTLERVQAGGTLRAGISSDPPWTEVPDGGEPTGVEAELVARFAEELGVRVQWVEDSQAALVEALHASELDVVVGGLTADTPWADQAGITVPYLTTQQVVGVEPGESLPPDLSGLEVAVEDGDAAAGFLRRVDAVPVRVAALTDARGPVAVDDWLLDDLGLTDSGVTLRESSHVMAVPLGENAWQVRLEQFLLNDAGLPAELLAEHGRP